MEARIVIEGTPFAKQRPRFTKIGNFVKTYTPVETSNYENWVKMCYRQQVGNMMFKDDEPLMVIMTAYFSVPKSWSKKNKEKALNGEIFPTNAKDVDNIAKIILDALNGVAYLDDHFITDLAVMKRYSETPHVNVYITSDREDL